MTDDVKQTILNKYGNPPEHLVDVAAIAELAWIKSLKPTLDTLTLVDCRILLNLSLLSIQNASSEYLLVKQIREERAERESKRKELRVEHMMDMLGRGAEELMKEIEDSKSEEDITNALPSHIKPAEDSNE